MIVIVAPYSLCETTAAAIRLADLASACGHEVRLVSPTAPRPGVHPYWDAHVRGGRGDGIYRACMGATHVVHFGWGQTLKDAKLTAEKAKHILVPMWHSIDENSGQFLRQFDLVVCPGQACFDIVNYKLYGGKGETKKKLTWSRWDPGLPPLNRVKSVVPERVRTLIWCDRWVTDSCMGPGLCMLVDQLVEAVPKLDVTIVSNCGWARKDIKNLKGMAREWEGRVRIKRAGDLVSQVRDFAVHDWVLVPSIRGEFSLGVSRALACGTPVVCFDLPPFSEHVTNKHNGFLIPCEKQMRVSGIGSPLAVPSFARALEVCQEAFSQEDLPTTLRQHNWALDNHQKQFDKLWRDIWGGVPA